MDAALRTTILSAAASQSRRYFIVIRLKHPAEESGTVLAHNNIARTELCTASKYPHFLARLFYLKTTTPLAQLATLYQGCIGIIRCDVYTVPSIYENARPLSAGGRERPILVCSGESELDGRTSEMLLHGSSIVLRMAMEHSDEYERILGSDVRVGPRFALPDSEGDFPTGGEHSEYLVTPEADFEVVLELSAAGTVLHRQLHAVARADGRDIPVDAVPENKPEGQTPPGSPLREARTHEDHPTQVSSTRPVPPTADQVKVVTRANPKVVALAEDRLLKNLGFSSSKLVPPSTMANVTLLVMRANRLPDLSTSSKSGLRGKPTTFVGALTVQGAGEGKKAVLTDQVEGNDPIWDEVLTLQVPDSMVPQERVLLGLFDASNPNTPISRVEIPLGSMAPGVHYHVNITLSDIKSTADSRAHPVLEVMAMISPSPARYISRWLGYKDTAYHSFRCAVSKLPNEAFKGRVRKRGLVFLRWRFDIDEASPGAPQFFAAQGTDPGSVKGALAMGTKAVVRDGMQIVSDMVPAYIWTGKHLSKIWRQDPELVLTADVLGIEFHDVTNIACDVLYVDSYTRNAFTLYTIKEPISHVVGKGVELGELKVFEKQLGKLAGERFSCTMRVLVTDANTELLRLGTKFEFQGNPVLEARKQLQGKQRPDGKPGGPQPGSTSPRGPPPPQGSTSPRGPPPPQGSTSPRGPPPPGAVPNAGPGPPQDAAGRGRGPGPGRGDGQGGRGRGRGPQGMPVGGRGPPPGAVMGRGMPPPAPNPFIGLEEDGVAGATRQLAEKLLASMFFFQSVVNTIATRAERAEASAERSHWRLGEAQAKLQDAHSELAQLERAFEGERSNRLNPPISDAGLALMTREELLARCYALSQSLFLEQQKTRELEAKHTRDHRNVVAAGVAIKRYQKLQDVLVQTRNALAEREGEAQRITAYKETVRSQEEVIRKLEAVVERLAGERSRAQEEMSTFKKRLEEANEQLRREMTVNESDMYAKLQGRITELWQQLEESQKEKSALQEQLQSQQMKTARAETRASALEEQIRELASKYSQEISSLRQQLIEKEAEATAARIDMGMPQGRGRGAPPNAMAQGRGMPGRGGSFRGAPQAAMPPGVAQQQPGPPIAPGGPAGRGAPPNAAAASLPGGPRPGQPAPQSMPSQRGVRGAPMGGPAPGGRGGGPPGPGVGGGRGLGPPAGGVGPAGMGAPFPGGAGRGGPNPGPPGGPGPLPAAVSHAGRGGGRGGAPGPR